MQSKLDAELLKLVINQCLAIGLRGSLNGSKIDADDMKNIEYRPVWTLDRATGGKKILRIQVRFKGTNQFNDLVWENFEDAGFTRDELIDFFDSSDAVRV